jgi:hypothetical protein
MGLDERAGRGADRVRRHWRHPEDASTQVRNYSPAYSTLAILSELTPEPIGYRKGPSPTAFEGLRLGMGEAVTVENWVSRPRSATLSK